MCIAAATPIGAARPRVAAASARASTAAPRAAPPPPTVDSRHADDAACIVKPPPAPRIAADASGGAFAEAGAAPAPDARVLAARWRVQARLRESADPYANAVAVWLAVPPGDDPDGRLAAERLRRLAALATGTRDPRLYALALRACWRRAPDACAPLSARRWAELDPGNAMPWTLMLDEAAERGDLSGMQEAMFHVTQSSRLDDGALAPLQPIVDAATGDDADLVGAQSWAVEAIGIAAAQVGPQSLSVCRDATPANANVWQPCHAMLDLLENRSDSLVLRLIGAALDKRLTGDGAAARRAAAQLDRWSALAIDSSTGCRDLRGKLDALRVAATRGEVALLGDEPR